MKAELNRFQRQLNRLRLSWWLGLAGEGLLWLLGLTALVLVVYGVADFFYALDQSARYVINGLIATTFVALLGLRIWQATRPSLRDVACRADRLRGDGRYTSLTTMEFGEAPDSERPLQQYLKEQSLKEGAESLKEVKSSYFLSLGALTKGLGVVALGGAVLAAPFYLAPEQSKVIAERILQPGLDTPPWSPLKFAITADQPAVIYGEAVLVDVAVSGGEIKEDVMCLVETESGPQKMPVFRVDEGQYRIKFDSVTKPLKLAFSTGHARSDWYEIEVLLKPQILAAKLSLTPPSYSRLNPTEGEMPAEGISGLSGTSASLTLESNRPLAGGRLRLRDLKTKDVLMEIEAEQVAGKSVRYDWKLQEAGEVEVVLRDVRGTEEVVRFSQLVRADAAPTVELTSPPSLLLATPESVLRLRGEARDDFALGRIDLIRSLVGYRDRPQTLAQRLDDSGFEFERQLDLGELGVKVGEVLEFFLEASDTNPQLTGVGSSGLVKVQVISREDYAQRLRDQTTLQEFQAKFEALSDALEETRESLKKLKKAIESGDPKAIEEAREEAAEAHRRAEELFRKIEKDFPAFELEKELGPAAKELADALEQNQKGLEDFKPDQGKEKQEKQLQEMEDRLNQKAEGFENLKKEAEKLAEVAKIQEMAAELVQIYRAQVSLRDRIGKLAKEEMRGNLGNRGQVAKLGQTQTRVKERLLKFRRELEKRGKELPPEQQDLADDVTAFLKKMDEMGIPPVMEEAAESAKTNHSVKAAESAALAAELLKKLIENDPENQFNQMAQGQAPGEGEGMGEGAGKTLQQLLDSMLRRGGEGFGSGAGEGGRGAGGGGSGMLMQQPSLNLPMAGPSRMRFGGLGKGRGNQGGSGKGGGPQIGEAERSQMDADESRPSDAGKLDLENVPEAYRDAVRRYFQSSEPQNQKP